MDTEDHTQILSSQVFLKVGGPGRGAAHSGPQVRRRRARRGPTGVLYGRRHDGTTDKLVNEFRQEQGQIQGHLPEGNADTDSVDKLGPVSGRRTRTST